MRATAEQLEWTGYREPEQVRAALSRLLRTGASTDEVQRVARGHGMEVSELVDDVIYASAPAKTPHPLIRAKWLVQFRFDDSQRLRAFDVEEGLIGP